MVRFVYVLYEEAVVFNRENPYRGLYAFELEQENYFCGREQAVRTLLDHLSQSCFLAVIGPSGCGKSSLVKAGLLPQLKRERLSGNRQWDIQPFTPGKYPLNRLVDIREQRQRHNQPLILFIDQFEEVFTLCDDEAQRREFIRLMAEEATNSECLRRVIVTIRGDFLERCADYPEAADLINEARPTAYIVKPLSRLELEETIEHPAALHGVKFERGLVSQIADDVDDQPGALPLLQYALKELWQVCIQDSLSPEPLLTKKGYEEIGGVKGALEKRANRLYEGTFVSDTEKAFVRQLFMELVQLGEGNEVTRRHASWERLKAIADSPEQLQDIVGQLADQRLIVTNTKTVEVAHEALLSNWSLLRRWIEEDRESIRASRQLEGYCREWQESFKKSDDALLVGARLAVIEEWVKTKNPKLPADEAEFLQKGLEKRDREIQAQLAQERQLREVAEARAVAEIEKSLEAEARAKAEAEKVKEAEARVKAEIQKKRIAMAAVCLLIGFVGLTIGLKQQAEQGEKAAINALIATPQQLYKAGKQIEALIESIKILKQLQLSKANQSYALNILQPIVSKIQQRNYLEGLHNDEVSDVSFSLDGRLIASASEDGTVRLWSKEGKSWDNKILRHGERVWGVDFSPTQSLLATSAEDGIVRIWDVHDASLKAELKHPKELGTSQLALNVSFSPNGQFIASANFDKTVRIWQVSTKQLLKTFHHEAEVTSVSFSSNSQEIVTASADGTIKLWNLSFDNNQPLKIFRGHTDEVNSVSFSPEDQYIVSGSRDRTIILWTLSQEKPFKVLKEHGDMVYSVRFSFDGQYIASGSKDGTVKVWSQEGKLLDTFHHNAPVNSVRFSPVNKIIASAGADRTVKLWSFDSTYIKGTNVKQFLEESCNLTKNYIQNNLYVSREDRKICKDIDVN